uniref:HTTM domain-containing protein n=1 Tax=Pedobacter schmidteae TaxID=2201271 RepID=UPI000EB5B9CA|nr:HTTM domain-containing protein [Pedobacter schmidteae]
MKVSTFVAKKDWPVWSYLEKPGSIKPVVFFRITLGIFAIAKIAVLYHYLNDVYGQYGYVQWAISKSGLYDFLPHLGDFYELFKPYVGCSTNFLYSFFWFYVLVLVLMSLGLFTRLSTILCFYLHLLWIDTGSGLMYGVDVFTQMALFYLMFMPAGSYFSLDVAFNFVKKKYKSVSAGMLRKLVQLQLILVYTSSGIEKGLGIQWWNGDAMWRSLMLPSFSQHDLTWLAQYPFILIVSGWLVVLMEVFYPVLLLVPKIRVYGILAVLLLHLSIGVFLGMWLFGFIMIILSAFAFGPEALADFRRMKK